MPWSPRQRSRGRGRERETCLVRSVAEGESRRPRGRAGAPAGRTGAGANRPTVRPRNAAPAGDCNRKGGRGNTEAAAVHKAGEERRRGATPATATPLTSSWKARDPVRPSKARPLRVRARRKKIGGRGSHREARVCRRVDLLLCCNGNNQAYAPRDNPASLRRVVRRAQAGHWRGCLCGPDKVSLKCGEQRP